MDSLLIRLLIEIKLTVGLDDGNLNFNLYFNRILIILYFIVLNFNCCKPPRDLWVEWAAYKLIK